MQSTNIVSGNYLLMLNDLLYASFARDFGGGSASELSSQHPTFGNSSPHERWLLCGNFYENRCHQMMAGETKSSLCSSSW